MFQEIVQFTLKFLFLVQVDHYYYWAALSFFPSKKMHFEKIYHHFYFYLKWNFFKCQIFQTVKKIEKKNCNDFPSDMIMFGSMQNKKNELRIQFSIKNIHCIHYSLLGKKYMVFSDFQKVFTQILTS